MTLNYFNLDNSLRSDQHMSYRAYGYLYLWKSHVRTAEANERSRTIELVEEVEMYQVGKHPLMSHPHQR